MRSDSHSPLPAPAGGSEVPCERSAARAASAGPALGSGSVSPDTGARFGVFVSPPSAIGKPAVPAPRFASLLLWAGKQNLTLRHLTAHGKTAPCLLWSAVTK